MDRDDGALAYLAICYANFLNSSAPMPERTAALGLCFAAAFLAWHLSKKDKDD